LERGGGKIKIFAKNVETGFTPLGEGFSRDPTMSRPRKIEKQDREKRIPARIASSFRRCCQDDQYQPAADRRSLWLPVD
jgi:hypothetical protein